MLVALVCCAASSAWAEGIDGYYTIKNNGNGKYVNVAGRKTVTFVDETATATAAGTVIRVKANAVEGKEDLQVEVLRSQGVDIPGYAEKAMNYVPKIVELAVNKLGANGEGNLLGANGLKAIMDKFKESFDYHLYLEEVGENSYRIYGRTPSMQPVVDFYAANKDNVDAKLPMLEQFINDAIKKVLQKTNGSGASILVEFKLHDVWQEMKVAELEEPIDDASKLAFLQGVLANKDYVWDFAYETAMIYWDNLKAHPRFGEIKEMLGEYAKYLDKVENIKPDFKYYIVQKENQIDFISQGNSELNSDFTAWTMTPRSTFNINCDIEQTHTIYSNQPNVEPTTYKEYYTTLYTDFAYTMPEDASVKAYTIKEISQKGVAVRKEITGIIPAQTPVLLVSKSSEAVLTLNTTEGTAAANELLGNDWLINKLQIKTPQVESLFAKIHDLLTMKDLEYMYDEYIKEYEHLMLRNAGTVNNKYFFGLSGDDIAEASMNICQLSLDGNVPAFYHNLEKADANKAFIQSETLDTILLSLRGDVNRDGLVTIADVTALVNIILGKVTYSANADKYDFEAANVNGDEQISIADVTALVNIILGK
jgi:hypothetical protein